MDFKSNQKVPSYSRSVCASVGSVGISCVTVARRVDRWVLSITEIFPPSLTQTEGFPRKIKQPPKLAQFVLHWCLSSVYSGRDDYNLVNSPAPFRWDKRWRFYLGKGFYYFLSLKMPACPVEEMRYRVCAFLSLPRPDASSLHKNSLWGESAWTIDPQN